MSDALYTPDFVAGRLKVKVKTLANWRALGKGPPFLKAEGGVRYPADLLWAWQASKIVTPK